MKREFISHAIETFFKGVKFRSRLEAKWAVFYETLGLNWHYEMEGFELPSGRYLPDFYFPNLKVWVEIKPEEPSQEEKAKCEALCQLTNKDVYLFWGPLNKQLGINSDCMNATAWLWREGDGVVEDYGYKWCECPQCGLFGIQFEGRAARLPCRCEEGDRSHNEASPNLLNAYSEATNRRFGLIA